MHSLHKTRSALDLGVPVDTVAKEVDDEVALVGRRMTEAQSSNNSTFVSASDAVGL